MIQGSGDGYYELACAASFHLMIHSNCLVLFELLWCLDWVPLSDTLFS